MTKAGWTARARYAFDNVMSKGTIALVALLGLASCILVLIISTVAWLVVPADVGEHGHWLGVLWRSLLRTMDPGTMGADEGSGPYLLLMFLATLGGIFIVSALVGVLATGLDAKIVLLSKGRSRIIERNHTVLLGWSDQVFIVIAELVKANESVRRPCIAILADLDRSDMEDMIRERLGTTGKTRVICRRGNPLKSSNLDLVSPESARSIIIMTPTVETPDVDIIKILLSLSARSWDSVRTPVVAAVSHSGNLAAAELAGGDYAQVVDANAIGIRLVVQSHRQRGLCTVFSDLLDFDGNELYMHCEPSLVGETFGQSLVAYEVCSPIGLRSAGGQVRLNPPMHTVIGVGDEVVMLAEDDVLIQLTPQAALVCESAITAAAAAPYPATDTLLLGWNRRADEIVRMLDSFAEPGSRLVVASQHKDPTLRLQTVMLNSTLTFLECDLNDRNSLEKLDLGSFEHLIVLSDGKYDPQQADARTLVTLLHLRDIKEKLGDVYSIVTEMNDDANRELADVTKADDFIVSSKLISLYLTQLSESGGLGDVFAELFSAEGSEIHLRPAPGYIEPGAPANFATVIEAGRRLGEIAIGYRRHDNVHLPPLFGVTLNPAKSSPLTLGYEDQVIVLADH